MELGDRIKKYRIYRKLTQEELAFNAGINEKYYWRIEHNKSCPTITVLTKICKALDINILNLLVYDIDTQKNKVCLSPKISEIIFKGFLSGFTVHFNSDILYENCESTVWYNGYIGSINFDEFELSIFAEGNVKGSLYRDYKLLEEFNSSDIANKIRRYISTDSELYKLIEYAPYDEEILHSKNGNVLFITESNWLTATIYNHATREIVETDIILDSDNIIEALGNTEMFIQYVFRK